LSVLDILIKYQSAFATGLATTFHLAVIIWLAGLSLGTVLGVLGAKWKLAIGIPSRMLSLVLSAIPILVFLFWLHYPLQAMLGLVIDPFVTAAVTLSIVNIFAVSDVIRAVLVDFPAQYVTAGRVCGMTPSPVSDSSLHSAAHYPQTDRAGLAHDPGQYAASYPICQSNFSA
jgi:His/Glu/Gln/Arg/opine family amino acid ABC transporter permease subunit